MRRQLFYFDQAIGVTEMMSLQEAPQALFDAMAQEVVGSGVISGLVVTHNSGYGVNVSAGAMFAPNGRRCTLEATSLSCTTDKDGVTIAPVPQSGGNNQERYVSIFAVHYEQPSNYIQLPDSSMAYYIMSDAIVLQVVAGPIAAVGSATRPALRTDAVLLADVLLSSNNALADMIYTDRRQKIQTLFNLSQVAQDHTHPMSQVVGLQSALDSLSSQIGQRAPSTHQHAMGDITGLSTALASKANATHGHEIANITGLADALASKASGTHSHAQGDITGLSTTLASKANSSHSHAQGDITGLVAALADKAASSHAHTASDVSYPDGSNTYKVSVVSGVLTLTRQ